MVYTLIYLALGILVIFFQQYMAKTNPTTQDKVHQMIELSRKHIESVKYPEGVPFSVSSAQIIGWVVGLIIGVVAWPLVAFNLLQRWLTEKTEKESNDPVAQEMGEFIREVTIDEIESMEWVSSTGAPNLPFGFLNSQWLDFRNKLKPGDTLWEYRYVPFEGQPYDAWRHTAEGYAIKRSNVVIAKLFSNAG